VVPPSSAGREAAPPCGWSFRRGRVVVEERRLEVLARFGVMPERCAAASQEPMNSMVT
jgi:hypothetical protein